MTAIYGWNCTNGFCFYHFRLDFRFHFQFFNSQYGVSYEVSHFYESICTISSPNVAWTACITRFRRKIWEALNGPAQLKTVFNRFTSCFTVLFRNGPSLIDTWPFFDILIGFATIMLNVISLRFKTHQTLVGYNKLHRMDYFSTFKWGQMGWNELYEPIESSWQNSVGVLTLKMRRRCLLAAIMP